jgi:hypothetical protein
MAAVSCTEHRLLVDASDLGKPMTNLICGIRSVPAVSLAIAVKSMETALQEWSAQHPASNVVLTKQHVKLACSYHEYVDSEHGLTADEIGAIHLYTQERPIHPFLNAMLRDPNREKLRPLLPYLRLLLGALAKLPKMSGTVYRGRRGLMSHTFTAAQHALPFKDALQVGKRRLVWWAASSTALDMSMIELFADQSGQRTVFRINAHNARDIMAYSAYGGTENEWLMPPGTQLRVTGASVQGDVETIELEEFGTPFTLQEFEDDEEEEQHPGGPAAVRLFEFIYCLENAQSFH